MTQPVQQSKLHPMKIARYKMQERSEMVAPKGCDRMKIPSGDEADSPTRNTRTPSARGRYEYEY
eukprot:scaffold541049_cov48-Prasinocladus_malaysianus.AAC.1